MHVQVIRVGRKRKQGKREPNGRAQRVYENPKAQVAAQPHRVLVMADYREWPEAESRFGRLMLNKHITPAQYEAGVCYRLDVVAYRNVILGAPAPDPAACDLLRVGGGGRDERELKPETIRHIKDKFDRAFAEAGKAGNRAQRALKDMAVFDKPAPLDLLISVLNLLIPFYGINPHLTVATKSAHVSNAR